MRRLTLVMIFVILLLVLVSCDTKENTDAYLPDFSGNTSGTIFVDYIKSYYGIGELAVDADLIAVGIIDRTIEVVPDEAVGDTGDPRARTYLTRSAFRVEQVIKGNASREIVISQMGAIGWAEEYGNPVFEPGERYFLFLRDSPEGIYYLLNPLGRFRITDGNVYSMNYVLPTGQSRPPLGLIFWKIDIEEFIGRVTEETLD